jgi:hypothetical protein
MQASNDTADFLRQIRDEERRQRKLDRQRVTWLMEAVQNGNVESFYNNLTADMMPWEMTLRRLAKLQNVPVDFQKAFQSAWIETKHIPLKVQSHSVLCAALRVMFPPYTGPAIRLFRGASCNEVRGRRYSLSWTDDRATAERFARGYSQVPHGGVILETIAPPTAIIAQMEYPEPWTNAEREEILREHPNVTFNEYHDEREFLVDRRGLGTVTVVQRFTGASVTSDPARID